MTELYVFRGANGHAEMATDDKNGKKLPSHPFGEWVFSRTIQESRAEATLAALKSRLALTPLSSATARGRPFPQQRWRLAMWRNFRSAPSFRRA